MAIIGNAPPKNAREALQDGLWLNGLANGQNYSFIKGLTATPGGTKAAAIQMPAAVRFVKFNTVATNGDSALLPQAATGVEVLVYNGGTATLSIFARGNDAINGAASSTNFDLTTKQSALFFCPDAGRWAAIKTA